MVVLLSTKLKLSQKVFDKFKVLTTMRFSHSYCRGIVTADVHELGLTCGAIAARKLEGVKRDKEHEGYTGSAPYGEGKSLRPVELVLIRVSMTRDLDCYAWLSMISSFP